MQKQSFIQSLTCAFRGILLAFCRERNASVQGFITIVLLAFACWLHLSSVEWAILLLFIAVVIALEMINSAIEKIADLVHPGQHPAIRDIKDLAAAAVCWASLLAMITGLLILLPKLKMYLCL